MVNEKPEPTIRNSGDQELINQVRDHLGEKF